MAQKFNVVRAKKYTQNNEEKTAWLPVGTITKFDNGNSILELNDREVVYQIFPFKKKEDSQQNQPQSAQQEQPTNDIQVENIPF